MVGHCRASCVEHGGDADARADVLGIRRDRQHRRRCRLEQQVIDEGLVVEGDIGDLGRRNCGFDLLGSCPTSTVRGSSPIAHCGTLEAKLHVARRKSCSKACRVDMAIGASFGSIKDQLKSLLSRLRNEKLVRL